MYTKPVSPQPIGGVLDSGFSLYRHSLKETFVFAFLSALVSAPAGRIVTPGEPVDVFMITVVSVVSFVLSLLLYAPIIAKIHAVQHGERLTAGEAMAVSLRRFPVLLGVILLYFLAVLVGFVALLIPGIFLAVAFVFAPIAAVTEPKGVIESLKYSFELVRGRWWRTAVLLTIVGIVAFVLYILVGLVVGIFVAIGGADVATPFQQLPWQIDFIVAPLIAAVLTPLFYALLMAIYADSKLRYEGADIAERIAAAEA
jgi:hypothetical protein